MASNGKKAAAGTRRTTAGDQPAPAAKPVPAARSSLPAAKAGQAELERARERYEQLVASVDGIVWEADADTFAMVFVSEQAERMLGYPASEWTADPGFWAAHIHPDDRVAATDFCRAATLAGRNHQFEYRMIAADGREVWLRDIVTVVPGPPRALRGIMIDITQSRRAEAELRASEERFRRLVETLSDVVYALDESGTFVYCSPAIETISSYRPDEVIGRAFSDFTHPDDLPALGAAMDKALAGGSATLEFRVFDKDGSEHWVQSSINPRLEQERVAGVTGVFSDVTARRRMIEALYESEARYRELVEMSPDSIVVHSEGRVVFANGAAAALAGAGRPDELIGRGTLEFVHPASRDLAIERIRTMMSTGRSVGRVEEKFLRLDGSSLDVEVVASPVAFRGRPSVQVVIHDITERKRAEAYIHHLNEVLEQRVRDRTEELVAANRELEAFSYSVSHDLRAPLRVIEGFARMFSDEYGSGLDEQARTWLERIHATSLRMDRLIHDLLAFSRMSRASMTVETVDLARVAREVAAELGQDGPGRRVEFSVAGDLVVEGDPELLRLVVANLLGNAWKYTSRRDSARVSFGTETVDGEKVYFVRDDGVGFDMKFAAKLFRPFQRLHAVDDFEGTGIGLATVQRIVERHGGRVWAESEPDRGTTFRFTLGTPRPG